MPKLSSSIMISLFELLKLAILAPKSCLHHFVNLHRLVFSNRQDHAYQECTDQQPEDESRPSPSLVPVPYITHVMSKLIKNKLPIVAFGEFSSKPEAGFKGDGSCAICLSLLREGHEVRLLGNCSHLFHRKCMDQWVEHGHGTCPLCRLKLLPSKTKDIHTNDPWREERIAYLFGEDYVLHSF